jgi:hypothetical protein
MENFPRRRVMQNGGAVIDDPRHAEPGKRGGANRVRKTS